MVVAIVRAVLRVGTDFREFFLLFLPLFFLLAGIGSLETSDVNFVHLKHGFHHALGTGGTFCMQTPARRNHINPSVGMESKGKLIT
jgi:hypothetical protein